MQTNELKIKNLVNHSIYGDCEITALDYEMICIQRNDLDIKEWFDLENFKPIPLTEELALKYGFENTLGNNFEMNNLRIYFDNSGIILLFYNDDKSNNECRIEVKYFHELQNIAYLFGKIELTLNK